MTRRELTTDVLVVGAGFAGLSTAYHLSQKGLRDLVVIEHDKKVGGHASGRNAGMIRQAISDPVLARLACEGRKALSRCGEKGWKKIHLQPNGSLLLGRGDSVGELKRIASTIQREGLRPRWLAKNEASKLVPLLEGGDFEEALYCPSDSMVDIETLLEGFLKKLKDCRVPVLLGSGITSLVRGKKGFEVHAGGRRIIAKRIVNAAGAWAGVVGKNAGASPVPLTAYRRHLFFSKSFRPMDPSWPFVWDLAHDFYFRPQNGSLLLSPCDKEEVRNVRLAVKKEAINPVAKKLLLKKLGRFSTCFQSLKIDGAKSGLRTMSSDGRFVIGEDPKLKGFFWVAGLGGHGVTTSFSVGDLASDLILGRAREKTLIRALSPGRFF